MSASPAQPTDGDEPTLRATTLVTWLRGRSDAQLATLLRLRPDLALPAPPDLTSLAGRIAVRSSTQRAVDGLDAFTLRALENLVLAAGSDDHVIDAAVDALVLDALFERALVWGEADLVHLTPTVREAIGPYPAGLGRPAAVLLRQVPDLGMTVVLRTLGLPPSGQPRAGAAVAELLAERAWIDEQVDRLDSDEREVLERLASGPPVGTVRNTRLTPDAAPSSAPHRLIARGLLVPIDAQRVELPREIGVALRDDTSAEPGAEPPQPRVVERDPADLDRLATTAVLETLRLVDALADSWTAHPPSVLRSGGLGVRELRRTARDLGVDEAVAALITETAYATGLINSTNSTEPVFLPSSEYDQWRTREPGQRWIALASAWLAMTRQPSLAGQRGDRDRVITALGPDAERGTIPALRRQLLELLAHLAPGSAPVDRDEVLAQQAWRLPRRASGQRTLALAVLEEADALGVTAAGGLTGYTRTLLAGSTSSATSAVDRALPEPVGYFLVQPDLTVVVPGPPEPRLGTELALVADLESTGGASVYRITERSVRRALDAGRTGEQLAAFVAERSRTPIPQALQYLIDDASRRHGVLRTGRAGAYLRCDDESLLARVLADRDVAALHLRLIAPTVVIAEAPVTDVLDVLREAGFAPAAESPDGELITIGVDPPRAPARPPVRATTIRGAADSEAQTTELVRRMRSGDALAGMDHRVHPVAQQVPGVTSAATMELLRTAVREAGVVWFGCAEADGSTTGHTMQPISLAAGTLRGYERGRSGLSAYPVHRITSIRVLDDDELDDSERAGP